MVAVYPRAAESRVEEVVARPAVQLPFFISLAILEPLFFGIGVAFLIFGFPWVQ